MLLSLSSLYPSPSKQKQEQQAADNSFTNSAASRKRRKGKLVILLLVICSTSSIRIIRINSVIEAATNNRPPFVTSDQDVLLQSAKGCSLICHRYQIVGEGDTYEGLLEM
jgi:hypothetical protein